MKNIVFDDMIADMLSNRKQSNSRKKVKYFPCFYHKLLFRYSKKC